MAGQFTLLDPAGAMESGQRMAMNAANMQQMGQQMQHQRQLGDIRNQAASAEGGYTPEAHKELLMNAGMFEEAQDIDDMLTKKDMNQQQMLEKSLNLVDKTAQLVNQVGAPAWPIFRGSLIAAGVADESSLPAEFNEQSAQMAQQIASKANEAFKVIQFRSGNQQRDVMNLGGKVTVGDPYDPDQGKGDGPTALQKNIPFLAKTMNITEAQAAEILTQSKDKSDAAIYQQLLSTALRATYGDQEEASKIAREGLNQVRDYRTVQRSGPVRRPGAEPSAQKFEEGKVYTDAAGNRAKYVNGNWEPVQ